MTENSTPFVRSPAEGMDRDVVGAGVALTDVASWATHLAVSPEALDTAGLRAWLVDGTLTEAFAAAARTHPRARLRIGDDEVDRENLLHRVERAATVLRQNGAAPGVRVLLAAPTSMGMVVAYLALLHVGSTVVLANPSYTGSELERLVQASAARLLLRGVGIGPLGSVPGLIDTPLAAILEQSVGQPRDLATQVRPDDVALLAFTSGTTGAPKGVPLTHAMLLASIRGVMAAWRWTPDDVLVHALPIFHQHGLGGIHASLIAGSHAVLLPHFDPLELVGTIDQERATVLFAVPSMYQRLMQLDELALRPLRRLRLATSGSAPLSPALAEAVTAKLGFTPLERYGSTESGLNVSNPYDGERVVGTVGLALPGTEVRILDSDGLRVTGRQEGEIALRGPQVFQGYLDDPAATAAAFWPGGWFRTGDLGRMEATGRLTITGRLKDLIISGGMNVSPGEVEKVLEQAPGVGEAAVAGVPNETWGEEVVAWVVPDAPLDPGDLMVHCRAQLAAYKCPKRVFVVDSLPHNAMGKLQRNLLRPPVSP